MTNPIETMRDEDRHAISLMKKAFPRVPEDKLAPYTIRIRTEMYATGRWPSTAELKATYDPYIGAFEKLPFWEAGNHPVAVALAATRDPLAKAAE